MAAFWYPSDKICQCWVVGDLGYDATYEENGATWIDFLSLESNSAPTPAQDWGEFTCPEGCYSGTIPGISGWCGWISIEPAAPSLGLCAGCPVAGQWYVETNECECYGDLKGLKAWFNYSSELLVIDRWDFTAPVATSTSTSSKSSLKTLSSVKTTSQTSSKTSLKSSATNKSSSKATTSVKPTSTSKLSSKSSSKPTSTSKTISKSSSSVYKTTSTAK
jgi:hypothetical protein